MRRNTSEDYAEWTDQNLKARTDFFAKLEIDRIAEEMTEPKRKKVVKPQDENQSCLRQSVRLQRKRVDSSYGKETSFCRLFPPKKGETSCDFDEKLKDCARFVAVKKEKRKSVQLTNVSSLDISSVSQLKWCNEESPTSIAIHPTEDKLVAAVGNSVGDVNIFVGDSCQKMFEVEKSSAIKGLHFGETSLISCGKGGTLRKLDLNRPENGFRNLFSDKDDIFFNGFHVSEANCDIWIAQSDGKFSHVDLHTSKISGSYQASGGRLTSISCFDSKNLLVASATRHSHLPDNPTITIWDTRMLDSGKPLSAHCAHSVTHALFNPTDPNVILTNGVDGAHGILRIYNVQPDSCICEASVVVKGFNTFFRPLWHPIFKNAFFFAGCESKLALYCGEDGCNFNNVLSWPDTKFSTLNGLLGHHPSLPVVLGTGPQKSKRPTVTVVNFSKN